MESKGKRIPKYCFEIPLSGVDYIYQSSFSHSPVVVMKPLTPSVEPISSSPRPTGEEEWDKFVSFVHSRSAIAFNGSYSENGKVLISIKTLTDYLSFVREEGRQEQLSLAREESFDEGYEKAKKEFNLSNEK